MKINEEQRKIKGPSVKHAARTDVHKAWGTAASQRRTGKDATVHRHRHRLAANLVRNSSLADEAQVRGSVDVPHRQQHY
jgi:hypothetical protein